MDNQYKYVSIDRILDKLRRDLAMDDVNETDVIEWSGEALEAIGAVTQYEQAVSFIEVSNYSASLPNGLTNIIQLARNYCWTGSDSLCPLQVQESIDEVTPEELPIGIAIDCNGSPLQDYELAYYRPYFDLQAEYGYWSTSNLYGSCFNPIRLTQHSFFDTLVCDLQDDVYQGESRDEYTVVGRGTALRFSFEAGQVALAYYRITLDEDGYPMIPDHYSYVTAITKYITYKLMEKRFYRNERGSESRVQKAENDWHWYCKQARNDALMLKGVDDHQDFMDQTNYILPPRRRYHGFFGNLNKQEDRSYNDPDYRNNRTFRGYGRQQY